MPDAIAALEEVLDTLDSGEFLPDDAAIRSLCVYHINEGLVSIQLNLKIIKTHETRSIFIPGWPHIHFADGACYHSGKRITLSSLTYPFRADRFFVRSLFIP